jgi:hypothetical protein
LSDASSEYVDLLANGLEESIQSFVETQHVHYASQTLAYLAELKRLRPNWRQHVKASLNKGELVVSRFALETLEEIAKSISLEALQTKMLQLESTAEVDELEEGDELLSLFVLDDVLMMRDRIHLVITELQARDIQVSSEIVRGLSRFDEMASQHNYVQSASPSLSGHSSLYDPATLQNLWWWQKLPPQIPSQERYPAFFSRLKEWLFPTDAIAIRRLAPIAVVTAILLVVGLFLYRPHSRSSAIASVNDGSLIITLDNTGKLSGFDSNVPADYVDAVAKSMQRPSELAFPLDALKELNPASGGPVQMGRGGLTFDLMQPIGTVISTDQPVFSWKALPGALDYVVTVVEYGSDEVATSQPVRGTTWKIASDSVASGTGRLDRDKKFLWQVKARLQNDEVLATAAAGKPSLFRVLGASDFDRLRQIGNGTKSHLVLGLAYSRLGLLNEAENEFRVLQGENPGNVTVEELRKSIETAKASLSK